MRKEYTPEDFRWAQWDAATITMMPPEILAEKRERYEAIKEIPETKRTFENTVFAIESSDYKNENAMNAIDVLMNASPDPKVRDAARVAIEDIQKAVIDIEYDEKIYEALKAYAAKEESLDGADKKLFDDMLRDMKRMGFEIEEMKRKELKENYKELTALETQFLQNINEYDDRILLTPEESEGLPEQYLKGLARNEQGNYIVTLKYPDYFPFVENAKNAAKRKELFDKNLKKGGTENIVMLKKILYYRRRNAELLGYANHADFRTETRMAKNAKTVKEFLDSLAEKITPLTKKDLHALAEEKRRALGSNAEALAYYDIPYYLNQLRKSSLNIDKEKMREYFPFASVKNAVFRSYETLFSVHFVQCKGYPLWHEDAELYRVEDTEGNCVAQFILDLYPREGKYGHAAMFPIIHGRAMLPEEGNGYVTPLCAMIANFNKPTEENPSLLDHNEVLTFFHEFGHVMHHSLSTAKYASQSGTRVERDFVEAPSQMFEYWGWDTEVLHALSHHYRTGETLSDTMVQNLKKTEHYMEGYTTMRQLIFGIFDLRLHTENVHQEDPAALYNETLTRYLGITLPDDAIFPAGFGHLVGYDAGYYGYMWSKVYAADMFTRFKKEGTLNGKTGMSYRAQVLEKGSSEEAMSLIEGFLGRAPSNEAFLQELGIMD